MQKNTHYKYIMNKIKQFLKLFFSKKLYDHYLKK